MNSLRSSRKRKGPKPKPNLNPKKHYDVHLSFCGKDTSHFVPQLYRSLNQAVVDVFLDEQRFDLSKRNRELAPEVVSVIGKCRIAIIVFSENFGDSRCCLQEVEKIRECGLMVVTLFYYRVRPLYPPGGGFFKKGFYDFFDEVEVSEDKFIDWVAEINKATTFSTHVMHDDWINVGDVVGHVTRVLHKRDLSIANNLVGLKSRVQDVIQLLNQSKHVLLLGIWGMSGIGKTAIAKHIYHLIGPYFEDTDFISVKGGKHYSKFSSKDINELQHKRVLVILDDVTKLEELNVWCGRREGFGKGSKIIITTTDRHLLREHGVDHIYKVKELGQNESLEVFNQHAFKHTTCHEKYYVELSRQFSAYAGGVPLFLVFLGSQLREKEVEFWQTYLNLLDSATPQGNHLQQNLKRRLKDLSDKEREIFFDIACFFVGMDQEDVLQTLERSSQLAANQISLLEDKSLLTIDENNRLGMHVLVQRMARDIIGRQPFDIHFREKTFDVFLSFRGEDSRAKFISHLYSSFQNAAIYAFRDDDEIQRGDQISMSIFQAIGHSRLFIIVLSRNYASSRWCMLELEKIMKNHRKGDTVVVPVFYEVDPSEVRNQAGEFGKAFNDLISTISVDQPMEKNWRRDLHEVGSIAGFVIIDSRNESADINNIVRQVSIFLDKTELFVAEHPVGIESRVQMVNKLLNIQKSEGVQVGTKLSKTREPEDVLLLGIWGMGGLGKTTVAKAIYNEIGKEFEGRSFLLDIRELWGNVTNRVSLQQLILCDIYKTTAWKIRDVESGKAILEERLSHKRVLVVLDDVNELDQLKALCGSRKWFGSGSRVIITTRDIDLLRSCRVDHVYEIKEMDERESLELFSWHAFKQASPNEDFVTHSRNVVAYSERLPLALQVLGSYLFDRGIKEWERLLEKLKRIPNDQVQKKLKLSFDGLSDDTEKQIFLDIACFFIGMDRNTVIQILNACDFFADTGVDVLIERSLVRVDNKNKLRMHDLLKTMGREIVREESPYDPEKRSRLWLREEVFDILSKHKGTEGVKGLALELPRQNTICLDTKAFKKMSKLRLLQLAGVKLNGDFKYLSGDLRWLCWHGFPSTYIPEEFRQASLVAIQLKYSNLKQVWQKSQMLVNLKSLDLSHSQELVTTPDFSYLPNLEKLVLEDCPSLSVVSHTIGSLHKLLLINLTDCKGLRELPRSIYTLKHLETLILSGCLMIEKLEEDLEQMESLVTLIADRTGIKKVPFSIVRSKSIGYISLCGFEGFSRNVFPSLIRSWMSPTNNVVSLFQKSMSMSSCVSSDFPHGTFKDLVKLRSVCVECGSELQLTQVVARILDALTATKKLEASTSATTSHIFDMYASPSKNYFKSLLIQLGTKCQVTNMVEDNILQSTTDGTDSNSDWLTFSCNGCSVIFEVPKMKGCKLKSMMFCIVYSSSLHNIISEGCHGVLIINYTKTTVQVFKRVTLTSFEDEDWQIITSNLEPGNKVEMMVVFGEGFVVEKTTLSLLYDETNDKNLERSHALNEEDVIVFGDNGISNHSNPPGEKNWDDGKEENPSKNEKVKSKVVQTSMFKTTMTSKKGSQTNTSVKMNSTSEDESKTLRKEDSSSKQTEKQKLSLPKNLKFKHSGKQLLSAGQPENTDFLSEKKNVTDEERTSSNPFQTEKNIIPHLSTDFPKKTLTASTKKQAADIEKNVERSCGSFPPKSVAGEPGSSNSNISSLDDFKKMLDIDPLAVMYQLLPREVGTSQTELFALEAELEKLRRLAFSDKLFAELPNNPELQSAINASIHYIEARHKDLNSQQYSGISAFSKLFDKAIESINAGNIVSHELSQLACKEKVAMTELQSFVNEIKQETEMMAEIEAESRQIEDQIASLVEKLRILKQEQNVLADTFTSCKVKHEEAMNKGKDVSVTVFSIREKIEGYKNQASENNAKYAELADSYERMKASPPF